MEEQKSYFPIVVLYHDRQFPETVRSVEEIRTGVSYIVIQTNRGD